METTPITPEEEAFSLFGVTTFKELYIAFEKELERLRYEEDKAWHPADADLFVNKAAALLSVSGKVDSSRYTAEDQMYKYKILWRWHFDTATWVVGQGQGKEAIRFARTALAYQDALVALEKRTRKAA